MNFYKMISDNSKQNNKMPPTETNLTDLFHVNATDTDFANSPIGKILIYSSNNVILFRK